MTKTPVRVSPLFLALLGATIAGGVLAAMSNSVAIIAGVWLIVLGGWATSLCLHEFGHALIAFRSGDWSVRAKGYLTLDPRHYTDPVLSIVLPMVFVAVGGIPLPGGAVWINHHALRSRRAESLVSLAGPLMNLLLGMALMVGVAVFADGMPIGLASGLSFLALLQVIAFVLNVLPIPGLDGYGAIEPWLSPAARDFGEKARPWAPLVLVILILTVPTVGALFFHFALAVAQGLGVDQTLAACGWANFQFWHNAGTGFCR